MGMGKKRTGEYRRSGIWNLILAVNIPVEKYFGFTEKPIRHMSMCLDQNEFT